MAAPMDHHRRQKSCDVRPAYREGRRERAVKVYTINQESRYLLVQGVPAIKVTDELLKRMSLYGTIEEYKILEDYPAEAFTKVYWVKYANIQAARMCKRKLDDQPFYGGTLHICYAPEYESVEDTRLKLQERRKDVARRLRKLQPGGNDVPHTAGHDQSSPSATQDSVPVASKSNTPTPTHLDYSQSQPIGPRKPDSTITKPPNTSTGSSAVQQEEVPLHLPAPPKVLPAWEWEKPITSHDQFPRLPTAHATLPLNYNPYPDDYEPHDVEASQEGACHGNATSEINPPLRSNILKDSTGDTSGLNYLKTGARPKFKLKQDRRRVVGDVRPNQPTFLERVAWREGAKSDPEAATPLEVSDDRRALQANLKRPYQNQYPVAGTSDQVPPNAQLAASLLRHPLVKRKHPADCPQPFLPDTRFQGEVPMPQPDQWKEVALGRLPQMPPSMGESSFDRMVHNLPQHQRNPTHGPGINAFNNGEYTQPLIPPRPAAVAAAAAAVAAAAAIAAAADGEPDSKRRRI